MSELNKKSYAVINGQQKRLLRGHQVVNSVKVNIPDIDVVLNGIKKAIANFAKIIYKWNRYKVVINYWWEQWSLNTTITGYEIYVPSQDCTIDELIKDEDEGNISWEEDCDYALEDEGGMTGPVYRNCIFYSSISVDTNGNIVGGGSGTFGSDYCKISADGVDTWYFIGDYDSDYTLYLFELAVKADITYSKGEYIKDVSSTSSSKYPTDGKQGDYWYKKKSTTTKTRGAFEAVVESENPDAYPNPPYNNAQDHIHTDGKWYERIE